MKIETHKMKAASKQHEWVKYLRFFSEQNAGRLTRLGVFESNRDVITDYWLESGLPLEGIDIDTRHERPAVRITVGNYAHEVKEAVKLVFHFSYTGDEDGIDVSDDNGRTTVLRFEL